MLLVNSGLAERLRESRPTAGLDLYMSVIKSNPTLINAVFVLTEINSDKDGKIKS